jgi:hypothetical protein
VRALARPSQRHTSALSSCTSDTQPAVRTAQSRSLARTRTRAHARTRTRPRCCLPSDPPSRPHPRLGLRSRLGRAPSPISTLKSNHRTHTSLAPTNSSAPRSGGLHLARLGAGRGGGGGRAARARLLAARRRRRPLVGARGRAGGARVRALLAADWSARPSG